MKQLIYISVLFFALVSCTKVIEVDLNSSDPQIVIEGEISNSGEPAIVTITKSINFDESNIFPYVTDALVSISDDDGNSEVLSEVSPGVYLSNVMVGSINKTYTLHVESNEKILTSNSIIPNQVNLDSLEVVVNTSGGFGGGGPSLSHEVFVSYSDPVDETNYYRFIEYINGEKKASYIFDDLLFNGVSARRKLRTFERDLEPGDTVVVEIQCIDSKVYDYFFSFGNLNGGPSSSSPANPNTNITGSKLGYFSAHTSQRKQVIIP